MTQVIDLVCLVADKNMEAAVSGLLGRPQSLGMREITSEVLVHPRRDPGCFHEAPEFLRGYRESAEHALVLLDHAWDGVPEERAEAVESLLEHEFQQIGMQDWAVAVVIQPELEMWVFSDSPQVAITIGWAGRDPDLRRELAAQGLWKPDSPKPTDPKAALDWALREVRRPRSSSIYRELARTVSTRRCQDRSFVRFRDQLREWFPAA